MALIDDKAELVLFNFRLRRGKKTMSLKEKEKETKQTEAQDG